MDDRNHDLFVMVTAGIDWKDTQRVEATPVTTLIKTVKSAAAYLGLGPTQELEVPLPEPAGKYVYTVRQVGEFRYNVEICGEYLLPRGDLTLKYTAADRGISMKKEMSVTQRFAGFENYKLPEDFRAMLQLAEALWDIPLEEPK